MAGRNVNKAFSADKQLRLFADYHAAIAAHGQDSIPARRYRNRIVEFNKSLVYDRAKIMANCCPGETAEDFEQIGIIGLIRAIELYDPTRGIRFSSYAMGFIKGQMLRHVRDNPISANPRVGRTDKDIYYRIVKLHKDAQAEGTDADIDEIALGLKKPNGEPLLTEYAWTNLQIAMSGAQVSELNEEIAGEVGKEEVERLVMSGEISPLRKDCLTEVVIKQPDSIPYADRVAIAAKRLRIPVDIVDQYTKMGLDQVRATYELALKQAEQV